MSAPLLHWYRREARDLPWRRTRDPWAILVSEVMLQQTQAARVVPYYERFLDRFPDPAACAAAPAAAVLRAWSGLGYNRRALALHRAAAVVAREGWPDDLAELPGVGPYTAAAVAAFAFGAAVLAVDVNVRRVLARTGRAVEAPTPELNQALMELGAIVCTKRAPRCGACPLADGCDGPEPHTAPGRPRDRFEDTDRWVRGRVVAALAAGRNLPDVAPDRLGRALAGLEQDGLIECDRGRLRLPGDPVG
ncbi:MAG TPA: A/G-specific adenine glycosylase [Solirubrobacteraceae bacterium]|nr:A/G-specific adenine glycosylase [Solirubrobacteraceae bacterium]